MAKIRVTQIKSKIGRPEKQKKTSKRKKIWLGVFWKESATGICSGSSFGAG